jgi:Domain of unknown function (DUF3368)
MSVIKMSEEITYNRRRFLGIAAMSMAAAEFVRIGSADAQSSKITPADLPTIKPLLRAKQLGLIVELRPLIARLQSEGGYYIDPGFIEKALLAAGE